VLDAEYRVFASDRYHAASRGVRLYLGDHPGYSFTQLMRVVSARLVYPEAPGRKFSYE